MIDLKTLEEKKEALSDIYARELAIGDDETNDDAGGDFESGFEAAQTILLPEIQKLEAALKQAEDRARIAENWQKMYEEKFDAAVSLIPFGVRPFLLAEFARIEQKYAVAEVDNSAISPGPGRAAEPGTISDSNITMKCEDGGCQCHTEEMRTQGGTAERVVQC